MAVIDYEPWAVEDGEEWIAAFAWDGDPVDLAGSELTVGPGIAVELAPSAEREPAERRFARQPRARARGSARAGEREKRQKLSRDLHEARAEHSAELVRSAREH